METFYNIKKQTFLHLILIQAFDIMQWTWQLHYNMAIHLQIYKIETEASL